MVKYCSFFFASYFQNILKTAQTILIKKKNIERNHGVLVFKKAYKVINDKNYILRIINYFFKMSDKYIS